MKAKLAALVTLSLPVVLTAFLSGYVKADAPRESTFAAISDGTYDVPGRPDLRLRVFVHNPHPGKPDHNPTLTQVCGLSDPDSSAVDALAGWHLPAGQWTYHLNLNKVPDSVGSNSLPQLATNAFNTWATAIANKVNFVQGQDTTATKASLDGQNIIAWGRTPGNALAVTYTWYNPSSGQATEEDTIFNSRFAWAWSGGDPNCAYSGYYDAQDILTHELGHWLGLDDQYSSSYTDNTMYGYGATTEVKKDTLTAGDVTGVSALYP